MNSYSYIHTNRSHLIVEFVKMGVTLACLDTISLASYTSSRLSSTPSSRNNTFSPCPVI